MKKILKSGVYACVIALCFGCSPSRYISKKSNKLVNNIHAKADTIYFFNSDDYKFLWYYKDNTMYSFGITPYKVITYTPKMIKNIAISSEELKYYFDDSFDKDVPCFHRMLDGFGIEIYIKNQGTLNSSIDLDCLFSKKYDENSFPYQLQHALSLIFISEKPKFDKLYGK